MLSKKRDRFLRVVDKQETMNGDGKEDDDEEEEGVRIERTRRERIIMNYMGLSEGLNQWGVSRPIKIVWPTSVFFSFNSLQFLVILQNLPNFV